jgi:hypothetical protein
MDPALRGVYTQYYLLRAISSPYLGCSVSEAPRSQRVEGGG